MSQPISLASAAVSGRSLKYGRHVLDDALHLGLAIAPDHLVGGQRRCDRIEPFCGKEDREAAPMAAPSTGRGVCGTHGSPARGILRRATGCACSACSRRMAAGCAPGVRAAADTARRDIVLAVERQRDERCPVRACQGRDGVRRPAVDPERDQPPARLLWKIGFPDSRHGVGCVARVHVTSPVRDTPPPAPPRILQPGQNVDRRGAGLSLEKSCSGNPLSLE